MYKSINALKCFVCVALIGMSLGACTSSDLGALGRVQKLQQVACHDGERPGRG
ncbi:hypothetical protein A8950_0704 [Dongia mobilis]|uniref:Small secreted protein n=1 Tax=Dongia mobilis TaxID=578943 RepID=A0A4R6WRM4_9PROT|nr:hypothetical protein [Dongia mobilis]TDQ84156.1 hypothetical protein A8950_0704 [Dongia mobilis]